MKSVLLMRHAKSDWGDPDLDDYDRPLNARGLEDVPLMGDVLARAGWRPDKVVASPALRAKQTAERVARAIGGGEIRWEPALYGAPGSVWLDVLRGLPDGSESVLIVAHSPGVEEAAATLVAGAPRRGAGPVMRFPTAAIASIEIDLDRWDKVAPGRGRLVWFLIPRLVKAIS